jgi:hypothetical protein
VEEDLMKRALVFAGATTGAVLLSAGSAFAASGPQSFTLTGSGNRNPNIVASGVIHGQAQDRPVTNTQDHFVFPDGSLTVNHNSTSQHQGPQVGCVFWYRENGTYQLGGGTGAYTGASGGGTYQLMDVFFAKPTPNGCSNHAGSNLLVIHAHGTTTLP